MTGVDFYDYCMLDVDQAYSDYTPPDSFNILWRAAHSKCLNIIALGQSQLQKDDLFSLLVTDFSVAMVNNKADLNTVLTDYLHILAVRTLFEEQLDLSITNASNTSPIKYTFNKRSKLRGVKSTSEPYPSLIKVSGVGGNTAANTVQYVKQLNDFQYAGYNDFTLSNPTSGNGTYTIGGSVTLIHNNWAKPLDSNARISVLSSPKVSEPRYMISDTSLSVFPSDWLCQQIFIDYIKEPTVFVDAEDNSVDLLESYTERYMYFTADKMKQIIKETESDYKAAAAATKELQTP